MLAMRHVGVWFAMALVVVGIAGNASAGPDPKLAQADKLFTEGRKLMDERKPAEACDKFGQAIELDPTAAGTELNLGLCNEALKKYKTALYWFRRAQVRASETGLSPFEQAAKEHTASLAALVASISIVITAPAPQGVTVTIDGDTVPASDFGRIEIDPGPHALDARAPGSKRIHQDFTIEGQGGQALTLAFEAGPDSELIDPGKPRRRIGIITAIGGGVLIAIAGGIGYHESQAEGSLQDLKDMNPSNAQRCAYSTANGNSCDHREHIAKVWGNTLFGVGLAAVAAGAILYITAPDKQRVSSTAFAPIVTPDSLGLALSGSF